jgi:hypothetical protein
VNGTVAAIVAVVAVLAVRTVPVACATVVRTDAADVVAAVVLGGVVVVLTGAAVVVLAGVDAVVLPAAGLVVAVVPAGAARSPEPHAASTSNPAHAIDRALMGQWLQAVCVWRVAPELVVALDDRFGEPTDAYVNGSQVWLRDDGPGGITIEWRLHPVPGYRRPDGLGTYEVFGTTALAVATGAPPPAPPSSLWEGLEAFAAYDDDVEPAVLAAAVTEAIGIPPDGSGLVDHRPIGDEWERSGGRTSIVDALFRQLVPK